MLYDIPFWISGLISAVIAPWRIYDYVSKEYSELPYYQKRHECFFILLQSVLDWILIILFLPCAVLTYPFRYPYINQTLFAIFKKDQKNARTPDLTENYYDQLFLFKNLQQFMIDYIQVGFIDILFSPIFFLPMLPLYTIPIYFEQLKTKNVKSHQIGLHRRYVFPLYLIIFMDIIRLLLLPVVYLTFYRIRLYNQIFEFLAQQTKKSKVQSDKQDYMENIITQYANRTQSLFFILYIIFFDLLSVVPRAIIFLTYIKQSKYKIVLEQKLQIIKAKKQGIWDETLDYEIYKCQLRYKFTIKLIIQLILGLICLAFSLIATWRIPFLIMLFTNKIFREQIINQGKLTKPQNVAKIYFVVMYSFICDIIFFPFLLISFVMSPLVVINYIKNITYRYSTDLPKTIQDQIFYHKDIIITNVFLSAIKDLYLTFRFLVVLLTGIRVPFLYFLVKKNQISLQNILQEYYYLVKPKSNRINKNRDNNQQNRLNELKKLEAEQKGQFKLVHFQNLLERFQYQNQTVSKKLTFRRCVNISFIETLKDFPIAIFSLVIMILFPWRIFSIISLWQQTLIKIPLIEDEFGKVRLRNIRIDLFKLFGEIITYDFPCVILNLILTVTIIKIPKVCLLFKKLLQKSFRDQNSEVSGILEQFNYRKELYRQVKILWQEIQTTGQYITVYILQIRYKSLKRRLKRFDEKQETSEKLKLYSLMNPVPMEDRPTRACMQTLSFNAYSKVAEFLDAKDLATMQFVNRKMYIFTKQDIIWEHLFNYKYQQLNINFYSRNIKLKCVEGYQHEMRLKIGKPISEEEKDEIIRKNHIIFDEYLTSIFEFPLFLVNTFGKIAFIFPKFPESLDQYQQSKHTQNRSYYIYVLSHVVDSVKLTFISDPRFIQDIKEQFIEKLIQYIQNDFKTFHFLFFNQKNFNQFAFKCFKIISQIKL